MSKRRGGTKMYFGDIDTAPHEFMVAAFAQHRKRIVKACLQLKWDVDHYNEYRKPATPIVVVFDFRNDLEELELARLEQTARKGKR